MVCIPNGLVYPTGPPLGQMRFCHVGGLQLLHRDPAQLAAVGGRQHVEGLGWEELLDLVLWEVECSGGNSTDSVPVRGFSNPQRVQTFAC